MKLFKLLLLSLLLASQVSAKTLAKTKTSSNQKLSTEIQFDGSTLFGRYLYSDEAIATVEDEKNMGRLIGIRMDFKDRLKKSVELK